MEVIIHSRVKVYDYLDEQFMVERRIYVANACSTIMSGSLQRSLLNLTSIFGKLLV